MIQTRESGGSVSVLLHVDRVPSGDGFNQGSHMLSKTRETEDGLIGKENTDAADAATGSGQWTKTVLEVSVDTELVRIESLRLSIDELDEYPKVITGEMNACSEGYDVNRYHTM